MAWSLHAARPTAPAGKLRDAGERLLARVLDRIVGGGLVPRLSAEQAANVLWAIAKLDGTAPVDAHSLLVVCNRTVRALRRAGRRWCRGSSLTCWRRIRPPWPHRCCGRWGAWPVQTAPPPLLWPVAGPAPGPPHARGRRRSPRSCNGRPRSPGTWDPTKSSTPCSACHGCPPRSVPSRTTPRRWRSSTAPRA